MIFSMGINMGYKYKYKCLCSIWEWMWDTCACMGLIYVCIYGCMWMLDIVIDGCKCGRYKVLCVSYKSIIYMHVFDITTRAYFLCVYVWFTPHLKCIQILFCFILNFEYYSLYIQEVFAFNDVLMFFIIRCNSAKK